MSEEELHDYDDEMEKLFNDIRKNIEAIKPKKKKPLTEGERTAKIQYINGRINRAKQVLRSYKAELRSVPKGVAPPYEEKAKGYKDTINQLISDFQFAQDNAALVGNGQPIKKDVDSMTADEILDIAKKTQKEDLDILDKVIDTNERSKEVAANTMAKLADQTDHLRKIDEGLGDIQTNLKMAARQLRAFTRRLATDKLIIVFIFLIVAGIIFVIVWSILHPNAKSGVPDVITNQNYTLPGN